MTTLPTEATPFPTHLESTTTFHLPELLVPSCLLLFFQKTTTLRAAAQCYNLTSFQSGLEFMAELNGFLGVDADFFLFKNPEV